MQIAPSTENSSSETFELTALRLGPLPLINHFLQRMHIEQLLEQHVPTHDRRVTLSHAKALGVLLRSVLYNENPSTGSRRLSSSFIPARLVSGKINYTWLGTTVSAALLMNFSRSTARRYSAASLPRLRSSFN